MTGSVGELGVVVQSVRLRIPHIIRRNEDRKGHLPIRADRSTPNRE